MLSRLLATQVVNWEGILLSAKVESLPQSQGKPGSWSNAGEQQSWHIVRCVGGGASQTKQARYSLVLGGAWDRGLLSEPGLGRKTETFSQQ